MAHKGKGTKKQTLADTLKRKEKYPWDSDMAKGITERVIKLITLDNQLISMVEYQGFLWHLDFLKLWYALPSLHYIDSTFVFNLNCNRCNGETKARQHPMRECFCMSWPQRITLSFSILLERFASSFVFWSVLSLMVAQGSTCSPIGLQR